MNGHTIKTLAEYIVSLQHKKEKLDSQYDTCVTDTNGVEKDWEEPKPLETFWPPYSRS
jgi:hypothetical protein